MKIAVLGGTFDPPHIGHALIAEQVLEKRSDIEEVWLVPAAQHHWKPTEVSARHRMEMLKLIGSSKIVLSDIEILRGGVSYTVDTAREIKEKFGYEVYWLIGSDIIPEFHKWKKADELSRLTKFLVFPRNTYEIPKDLPPGFEAIPAEGLITSNISSALVRARLKKGLPIKHLVPQEIEEYIKKNNLYK